MKYVKLIAKPGTWFKVGTEVFHYDYPYNEKRRITLEEFEKSWKPYGIILVCGVRVCELGYETSLGCKPGQEREDGECCGLDEFDIEIVEE